MEYLHSLQAGELENNKKEVMKNRGDEIGIVK